MLLRSPGRKEERERGLRTEEEREREREMGGVGKEGREKERKEGRKIGRKEGKKEPCHSELVGKWSRTIFRSFMGLRRKSL